MLYPKEEGKRDDEKWGVGKISRPAFNASNVVFRPNGGANLKIVPKQKSQAVIDDARGCSECTSPNPEGFHNGRVHRF